MPVDYASQSYWESRLAKECATGYEWLVPSSAILPIISAHGIIHNRCHHVLHFGCGSSFLGRDLQQAFGSSVAVVDADFAVLGLQPDAPSSFREVPLLDIDVLSLHTLQVNVPTSGWDLLVDKSTADAISCGPPCSTPDPATSPSSETTREAIDVLCDNLAQVARTGARWISISYSSERFNFLSTRQDSNWHVVCKLPVKLLPVTTHGSNGIVYQPETGVWAWILERR